MTEWTRPIDSGTASRLSMTSSLLQGTHLSAVEDRQVQLAEASAVGEQVDFDDFPARHHEVEDDTRLSTWRPCGAGGSHLPVVVARQSHSLAALRQGKDERDHGPVGYMHVSDIQESLQLLFGAGVEVQQEIKDFGRGRLIATVKDADGNIIGLIQDSK